MCSGRNLGRKQQPTREQLAQSKQQHRYAAAAAVSVVAAAAKTGATCNVEAGVDVASAAASAANETLWKERQLQEQEELQFLLPHFVWSGDSSISISAYIAALFNIEDNTEL